MITTLSILGCILAMTTSWFVARGQLRVMYPLSVVTAVFFISINVLIAVGNPGEIGVLALIVPSVWSVITAVIGMRRLRRHRPCGSFVLAKEREAAKLCLQMLEEEIRHQSTSPDHEAIRRQLEWLERREWR